MPLSKVGAATIEAVLVGIHKAAGTALYHSATKDRVSLWKYNMAEVTWTMAQCVIREYFGGRVLRFCSYKFLTGLPSTN